MVWQGRTGNRVPYADYGGRFASCRTIATDLNARRIPSPGSSWKRSTRRAAGWMGSGVRVILRNERYRGVICWNASEWVKDPDTGRRKRVPRPRKEWISHVDESLRIISDDLWDRAWRRVRPANTDKRLKAGGKPKYLLSGLLRCDVCDAHYTITNATSYGCSGYHDGRACGNSILVRRDRVENILLGPILNDRCTQQAVVLNLITIGEAASRTMNGLTVTEQDSSPRRASRSEALTSIRARREVTRTFCVIARVFAVDRGEPARHTDP